MAEFSAELAQLGQQLGDIAAKFSALQAKSQSQAKAKEKERVTADAPHARLGSSSRSSGGGDSASRQSAQRLEAVLERGISLVTDGSENEGPVRPQLYPGGSHQPTARLDQLEHDKWDQTQVLDALKLDTFEGFYNLAMQVLVLAMVRWR